MANTPIPSRAIEYSSTGTSGLREYTLTPEQLEEVRQKYPATKRDKTFKKPVAHNPREDMSSEEQRRRANKRYQNQKEDDDMGGQRTSKEGPSCGLTKQVFIEQIASGETVASVEKAWGMKFNTLSFWVKKWELKGINAAKAQELLSGNSGTNLLREKEVLSPDQRPSTEMEQLNKAMGEIEQLASKLKSREEEYANLKDDFLTITEDREALKIELAEVKQMFDKAYQRNVNGNAKIGEHLQAIHELREEVEHWRGQADNAGKTNTQLAAERESAQKELVRAVEENDRLRDEINRMITERDELMAENDRLESQMVASRVEPQLADKPSEVQLLDRSIADLTRAKWILNRLTASGE